MKKYPAPVEAPKPQTRPEPAPEPKPPAQVAELPQIGMMAGAMSAVVRTQLETQEKMVQLIEEVARQNNKVVRVQIIRDAQTGNMNELIIMKE